MSNTKPANTHRTDRRAQVAAITAANVLLMTGASVAQDATTTPAKKTTTPAQPAKKDAAPAAPTATSSGNLNEVVVTAKPDGYQVERLQSRKYSEPLINLPATITVVPKKVIQDQAATSLREVLTNVPGITYNSGEGGGGLPGDNINVRGFNARNDIFVDGFRDTGTYSRDPFNLEQVEVSKGPASTYNGQGSTGGSVNLGTKAPSMTPRYEAEVGFGTEMYFRDTVDVNQPLQFIPNAAARVSAVYQYDEQARQDDVYASKWGVFPSLGFGIDTNTRATVNYLYFETQNMPSYGIPMAGTASYQGTEDYRNPVPYYDNFYGVEYRDYEDTVTHMPTLTIEHDFNDCFSVQNITRYSFTERESIISRPQQPNRLTNSTAVNSPGRNQIDTLVGNIFLANYKFETWKLRHEVIGTIEYTSQVQDARTSIGTSSTATSISDPNVNRAATGISGWAGWTRATLDTFAVSLSDTINFNEQWILNGGMRYDNSTSQYETNTLDLSQTSDTVSWRLGLTYKPLPYGAIYFGYGNSFNPSIVSGSAPSSLSAANANLQPEESDSFEFGTKWDLLNEKLSVSAALFRTIKNNTRVTDPVTGFQSLGGEQQVQGIELGVAGNITDNWAVFGGYAYMDSEVLQDPNPANSGNPLANTPEQSASLWTTYDLPCNFRVGTGVQFVDRRFATTSATSNYDDSYITQSLMIGYSPIKHVDIQLNVNNLWDEKYIASLNNTSSLPGNGRNLILTTRVRF
ncbi:hypothetical protein DB346_06965 [Verrucomicrobia bacterium LW23]|nr:hypothetical protein DB346_06965 [Verrucomicrobia bacterium LW23]